MCRRLRARCRRWRAGAAGQPRAGGRSAGARSSVAPGLRICKYIQCKSGNTTFTCPSNTSPDTVDGIAGCCWTGNASVEIVDLDCSGTTSENTNVYLRVDAPSAVDCLPYSVAFHY